MHPKRHQVNDELTVTPLLIRDNKNFMPAARDYQ
jgi:hypothetical protein